MNNTLQYLKEVKHIQELTQQMKNEYVYITYKMIWRKLCTKNQFFKGYRTFMKYISEPQIKTRIEEQLKTEQS